MVGYREGAGDRLVSESAARRFERDWRGEVRSATVETLAEEGGLLRILTFPLHEHGEHSCGLQVEVP